MYRRYEDLRSKLGTPQWHDENGVPRYCAFHPSRCGIYDTHVALLEIECQSCGERFLVTDSWNPDREMDRWLKAGRPANMQSGPELPTATNYGGDFSFGDAPWHGEHQCAGTTMTTDTRRVVEFWTRDRREWERQSQYEFSYDPT